MLVRAARLAARQSESRAEKHELGVFTIALEEIGYDTVALEAWAEKDDELALSRFR